MKKLNIIINFLELKYRIIYFVFSFIGTFSTCFYFKVELFYLISNFFLRYENGFIYTSLFDPLIVYIKLSFLFTLIFIYPIFGYFIIFFFLRSLTQFYLSFYIFYWFLLYFLAFTLFIVFSSLFLPFLLEFLLNFQRLNILEILEISLQATINQYYNFFFSYIYIYSFLILVPNIFLFLIFLNVFPKKLFFEYKFRKYLYFIIFISFLVVAPPDFFVQLLIFPIIVLLLEVFIYLITFLYILYYSFNTEERRIRTYDE